jgi:hypothetical protein
MDIVLRLLCIAGIFVSFGEGVCVARWLRLALFGDCVITPPLRDTRLWLSRG